MSIAELMMLLKKIQEKEELVKQVLRIKVHEKS